MTTKTYKTLRVWSGPYWDLRTIAAQDHASLGEAFAWLINEEIKRRGLRPSTPLSEARAGVARG